MDEAEVVKLVDRLKKLQEEVSVHTQDLAIQAQKLPPLFKKEIAEIYSQYGGMQILHNLLNIPMECIRDWHKQLLRDPNSFFKEKLTRFSKSNFISKILGTTEAAPKNPKSKLKLRRVKFPEQMNQHTVRRVLEDQEILVLEQIKRWLSQDKQKLVFTQKIKKEICRLVLKVGHPTPVALFLGVAPQKIEGWTKDFLSVIEEEPWLYHS